MSSGISPYLHICWFFCSLLIDEVLCATPPWKTALRTRGIVYKPLPSDIDPAASDILADSDLYNTDFTALWGVDERKGITSRDDIKTLVSQGFNQIHIYDWNPRDRQHIPFLDHCASFEIGVWVPISNFAVDDTTSEIDEDFVTKVIDSTRKNGAIHPAVFGWMILNEYDLVAKLDVDSVVDIIDIVAKQDPGNTRPFCIPVSTQAGYLGVPEPGLGILVELHDNLPKDIFQNRLMHGTNPFMPFENIVTDILDPYLKQFQKWKEDPVPLLLTEIGRSSGDVGEENQDIEVSGLAEGFMDLMTKTMPNPYNFAGFFLFEYTQEAWKGGPETLYGLNALGDEISDPRPTTQVVAAGIEYKVEELKPVKALVDFVNTTCARIKDLKSSPIDNLDNACNKKENIKPVNPGAGSSGISVVAIAIIITVGVVLLGAVTAFYFWKRKKNINGEPLLSSNPYELRKSTSGSGNVQSGKSGKSTSSGRNTTSWV